MTELTENSVPIVSLAYLYSHQEEVKDFIKERSDIENHYSDFALKNSDPEDPDYCEDIEEFIESFYWSDFVKFHDNYLPFP